jgi:hypothetical protein
MDDKYDKFPHTIKFDDYPEFRPNLTPRQVIRFGSFGGTYWRPIYSNITKKKYENIHKNYNFFRDLDTNLMIRPYEEYDKNLNKYGVKVGTTLEDWERAGWISELDPYGWFQWYVEFSRGRRNKKEDERQVKRWLRTAGPESRFRKRLINMIIEKNTKYNDFTISPKIRQTLQHWGYQLTKDDIH